MRAICVTCFTLITYTAGSGRGHRGASTARARAPPPLLNDGHVAIPMRPRPTAALNARTRPLLERNFAIAGGLDGAFNDSRSRRCRRHHRVLSSDRKELRTQTGFATFSSVAALRPRDLISPKNLAPRKRLPGPWWDAAAEVARKAFPSRYIQPPRAKFLARS